ncbi:uncharacterized protein LOC121377562 [Gigantopelta aegis]|uniref:uncharacterized protein LOC121377562 n=1 Tax=Gigantopelta aegis TaxID=1735272 RepID=UPI001B88CC45|nr:uncharacterized protein LOC121377562 [Gigantopelta aegis]
MMNLALRIFVVFAPCLLVHHVHSETFLDSEQSANLGLPQKQFWEKEDASSDRRVWSPIMGDNSNLITDPDRKYSDTKQRLDDAYTSQLSKIKQTLLEKISSRKLWLQPTSSNSHDVDDRRPAVKSRYWLALARWMKQHGRSPEPEIDEEAQLSDLVPHPLQKSGSPERVGIHNSKKSGALSINGALLSLADLLSSESQRRNQQALRQLHQRLLVAGKR